MNVSELAYVAEPLSTGSATMQCNAVLCNTEKEMSMTCLCQGYGKGMYKEEILLFCNIFDQKSLVFLLQKIFLAFIKAYYMALEC